MSGPLDSNSSIPNFSEPTVPSSPQKQSTQNQQNKKASNDVTDDAVQELSHIFLQLENSPGLARRNAVTSSSGSSGSSVTTSLTNLQGFAATKKATEEGIRKLSRELYSGVRELYSGARKELDNDPQKLLDFLSRNDISQTEDILEDLKAIDLGVSSVIEYDSDRIRSAKLKLEEVEAGMKKEEEQESRGEEGEEVKKPIEVKELEIKTLLEVKELIRFRENKLEKFKALHKCISDLI